MKRCAVYTRKSSDEGLEQDFNSLQAQREACEAFIKSQKHQGWKLVRRPFDDGGHSGGTLDRPALLTLLEAVDRNEVDVVVVYKVDRLTRSLADFAKIVERFDERGVSFVSVTQQFNTTTSMGRLTLNVLLSFAQFEREVTAERIRDKIAASKRKGMWMGGLPPLGYDVRGKKLVVNEPEAETVRRLYRLYLEHGTVRAMHREASRLGIVTKVRTGKNMSVTGGKPFTRGNLYQLLRNPLYVGRLPHKGETYPGQHTAIIDDETWQTAQKRLSGNAVNRHTETNARSQSLLSGLLFDETGDRLCPTHANKGSKRYRYYISKRLMHDADCNDGWRLPADEIESCVMLLLGNLLSDRRRLSELIEKSGASVRTLKVLMAKANEFAVALQESNAIEKSEIVAALVERVELGARSITLMLHRQGLVTWLGGTNAGAANAGQSLVTIQEPIALRRRGVEARLVFPDQTGGANHDQKLCRLIGQARNWFDTLAAGRARSIRDLAQSEGLSESEITRALPLAFLAPDLVDAILDGRQPAVMTTTSLKRLTKLPADWTEQRRVLGF